MPTVAAGYASAVFVAHCMSETTGIQGPAEALAAPLLGP
jgi:hypothetical protein